MVVFKALIVGPDWVDITCKTGSRHAFTRIHSLLGSEVPIAACSIRPYFPDTPTEPARSG